MGTKYLICSDNATIQGKLTAIATTEQSAQQQQLTTIISGSGVPSATVLLLQPLPSNNWT